MEKESIRQPRKPAEKAIILLPYTKTERWRGRINYTCNCCRFATLDESRMQEHIGECRALHGGNR